VALPDDRASLSVPHRVRSVDRAVALLKAVAEAGGGHSLTALARRCDLDRATAWRLLITLEAQGMVVRDPRDGLFTIGPAVTELSTGPAPSLLHTAQGRFAEAELHLDAARRALAEDAVMSQLGMLHVAIADLRLWQGRPADAHEWALRALLRLVGSGRGLMIASLLAVAARFGR